MSTTTSTSTGTFSAASATAAKRQSQNRFGLRPLLYIKALFGPPSMRRLAQAALQINKIRYHERQFKHISDEEIKVYGRQFRGRARGGESLDKLLPEIFGLVCVASQRAMGLRPYDVQLAAGVLLHRGCLAEVATGEGKTLVATLPAALNALLGKGVHVTTTNDYLARRDGEYTEPIYNALGLSVGILQQRMSDEDRTAAYKCDITYSTASELGFDFLRDRLKTSSDKGQGLPFWAGWTASAESFENPVNPKVQREHHYALVDEADNIFIDEAKTPLIIGGPSRQASKDEQVVYIWADNLAQQMQARMHFMLDPKKLKVELTDEGRKTIRYSNPPFGEHSHAMDKLHEHVERAIQAHFRFRRDQHYMIEENKVVIIDESTGRRMPDRHWREGLHQAVEAKERVPVTMPSDHAAQITFQSYFRLYKKLAGMSGTAAQNWFEVRRIYKLWVIKVPTNMPVIREHFPDRVYPTEATKFMAIAGAVRRLRDKGRPVLVGTRSVETSEKVGKILTDMGIEHQVLNARPDIAEREAEIVSQAGRPGAVTIATNMAGRGTDIILGGNAEALAWSQLRKEYAHRHDIPHEVWQKTMEQIEATSNFQEMNAQVVAAGGLHVIGTERHEALRIDRQLAGRSGRQGDPGSCQFYMSLEDELLEGLGPRRQAKMKRLGEKYEEDEDFAWEKYLPIFLEAQKRMEKRHYRQRMDLVIYEKNRQEILKDLGADPYVD